MIPLFFQTTKNSHLSSSVNLCIAVLREPSLAVTLDARQWERVLAVGRAARLLATLRTRLERNGLLNQVPERINFHLDSDFAVAKYLRQMALVEIRRVETALHPLSTPLILLKGAGYLVQKLGFAQGRQFSDVDVLVSRDSLGDVEERLLDAGWEWEKPEAYDQHYYRAWSHELPPLRFHGHALELDVHHAILPPTGRVHPDLDLLFRESVPVANSIFRVLSPLDQVLHVCAHVFQDSDCTERLRDLFDLDGLLREHVVACNVWRQLILRAECHQLSRPLWYGLRYCARFLHTPVPATVFSDLAKYAPSRVSSGLMDRLVTKSILPNDPDHPPTVSVSNSRTLLSMRYHWLRMPIWLLARHALSKLGRYLISKLQPAAQT